MSTKEKAFYIFNHLTEEQLSAFVTLFGGMMSGEERLYRLRVGDYRILFEMYPKTNTITLIDITDADNRGQIYK